MDVMLQEHDAKLVLPVPEGLRELACDISREVLRSQPNHIYQFIADYTAALLETRDKAREAVIIVHDILEQGLTYEAMLQRQGISLEVANRAATIIQAAYRGHLGRKLAQELLPKPAIFDLIKYMDSLGVPYDDIVASALKIQALYRGYKVRKNIKKQAPEVSKSLMDFLVETGVTLEEANRAATCIQRGFRKYTITKREKSQLDEQVESQDKALTVPAEGEEGAEAAKTEVASPDGAPAEAATPEAAPAEGATPEVATPEAAPAEVAPAEGEPAPGAEGQGDQGGEGDKGPTEGATPESPTTTEAPDTGAPPSETTEATTERDQQMSEMTTDDEGATTSPETSVVSPEPTTDGEGGTSPERTDASATGADDTDASEMGEEEEE